VKAHANIKIEQLSHSLEQLCASRHGLHEGMLCSDQAAAFAKNLALELGDCMVSLAPDKCEAWALVRAANDMLANETIATDGCGNVLRYIMKDKGTPKAFLSLARALYHNGRAICGTLQYEEEELVGLLLLVLGLRLTVDLPRPTLASSFTLP